MLRIIVLTVDVNHISDAPVAPGVGAVRLREVREELGTITRGIRPRIFGVVTAIGVELRAVIDSCNVNGTRFTNAWRSPMSSRACATRIVRIRADQRVQSRRVHETGRGEGVQQLTGKQMQTGPVFRLGRGNRRRQKQIAKQVGNRARAEE